MRCSIPFYAFIIIICMPIQFMAYASDYDKQHFTNCAPFRCGNISEISYPFRSLGGSDYCGHPRFEVECAQWFGLDYLFMTMESVKYMVNSIAWEKQRLNITRPDLLFGLCPELKQIDTILDHSLFDYVPGSENATLYYDCKESWINDTYRFCCDIINATRYGYLSFYKPEPQQRQLQLSKNCSHNITVPLLERLVPQSSHPDIVRNNTYAALFKGFEVTWKVDMQQCRSCNISGGRCGHDTTTQEFKCFCPEGVHPKECPRKVDMQQCGSCNNSGGTCGHDNTTKEFKCFCPEGVHPKECPQLGSKSGLQKALVVGSVMMGGFALIIILLFLIKKQQLISKIYLRHQDIEDFIRQYGSLAPKRYSYSEVKRMTNSYKNKLGQGGYGAVYKGMLPNGCTVAVKILKTTNGNGEEFINEVVTISRTSHVNIVTLLGFCFEGKTRALIYEFMANGSLDKFIHGGTNPSLPHTQLGCENLYQIAIGIAQGLEYLHCGCNTKILHFDIKPHNILLDEKFHPKISDFGLAKICLKKESIVSSMIARGTIGYIAPEVFNRNFGGVSSKSDVYSYGMVVLEMIGLTKKINVDITNTSQLYFPDWIYDHLELSQDIELYGALTLKESEIIRKLTLIGLWCIQMKPSERPSMSKVIDMLEGSVEALQIPPKPFFTSPPRVTEGSYSALSFLTEE